MTRVSIEAVAVAPQLNKQLNVPEDAVATFQQDLDAWDRCRIRGWIPRERAWTLAEEVIKKALLKLQADGWFDARNVDDTEE